MFLDHYSFFFFFALVIKQVVSEGLMAHTTKSDKVGASVSLVAEI